MICNDTSIQSEAYALIVKVQRYDAGPEVVRVPAGTIEGCSTTRVCTVGESKCKARAQRASYIVVWLNAEGIQTAGFRPR